jgi:hypothetical protein
MTKRERRYLDRLEDRARILRHRIGHPPAVYQPTYVKEWEMELHALEWAIGKLSPSAYPLNSQ